MKKYFCTKILNQKTKQTTINKNYNYDYKLKKLQTLETSNLKKS